MAKTATVKITGDHHIIYGVDRQVLRKGSIVELPVSELAGWKNLYQVEVLSGDVYGPDDLPRLQKQARRLQGELAHVLRGLSACSEATGVPMDVAFEGLSDLPEFQGATDYPSE